MLIVFFINLLITNSTWCDMTWPTTTQHVFLILSYPPYVHKNVSTGFHTMKNTYFNFVMSWKMELLSEEITLDECIPHFLIRHLQYNMFTVCNKTSLQLSPVAAAAAVGCEPTARAGGVVEQQHHGEPRLAKKLPLFPHRARWRRQRWAASPSPPPGVPGTPDLQPHLKSVPRG